ncbi:MAG: L-threonylcarbamoyladenylate synthase [Symbiobacteriia bacterium]
MKTRLYRLQMEDPHSWQEALADAARTLRAGGLVAFPTETVYGLGANALDPQAVRRIFAAKGRPQDNPLIIHVAEREWVFDLAEVTPAATALMQAFWPGPLTLVLPHLPAVPLEVTAGLQSVAVRMPSHPVGRAMIAAAGLPVAAPSANRSGRPSPTCAEHVMEDLNGLVEVVLDGGPAGVGLESTVVDCTLPKPRLLRPGEVTPQDLERVVGPVDVDPRVLEVLEGAGPVASPGMKYRHYAPDGDVTLYEGDKAALPAVLLQAATAAEAAGRVVALLASDETLAVYGGPGVRIPLGSRGDLTGMAGRLFEALRQCDRLGAEVVLIEGTEPHGLGLAITNRLRRAAGGRIVRL